jgi:hypothetical protein
MSEILNQARDVLTQKLGGSVFEGSAKFSITDEGSLIVDCEGGAHFRSTGGCDPFGHGGGL